MHMSLNWHAFTEATTRPLPYTHTHTQEQKQKQVQLTGNKAGRV